MPWKTVGHLNNSGFQMVGGFFGPSDEVDVAVEAAFEDITEWHEWLKILRSQGWEQ